MYLAAVATCAKNFAEAKYRGVMLAVPIAAFGLSGMWQSQVGAHLLYKRLPDGQKGPIDVFRYFIFLAGLLIGVGLLGTLALKIVGEDELIDHGVEQLERSGLLEESDFFRSTTSRQNPSYGTMTQQTHANDDSNIPTAVEADDDDDDDDPDPELNLTQSLLLQKQLAEDQRREKKSWLLNHAMRTFLSDRTMYLLAGGFLLLSGPGEAYINNVGTIIPTLTPSKYILGSFVPTTNLTATITSPSPPPAGLPETHVSIIALTSTFARLFTGTLSDLFAPPSNPSTPPSTRIHLSRLALLIPSAILLLLAFFLLAVPALVPANPSWFLMSSALLGLGYGASFSLVPIIISVVWGAENFATNWGFVAMMPAGGAAVWSVLYSVFYSRAAAGHGDVDGRLRLGLEEGECRGYRCYGYWAWGCMVSVGVAIVLWLFAWRTWRRRDVVV